MSDKAKYGGAVWFVRGVPAELRAEVAAAAERAGMKVGAWVERALRAALERPEGQGVPAGQGAAGDLAALVAAISATVDAQAEAIHVLFEHRHQDFPAIVERLERLEAQVGAAIPGRSSGDGEGGQVETAIPGGQGSAPDAVEPVGDAEVSAPPEALPGASGGADKGKQSRQKWTDADDDVLRRTAAEGGTQADAVRELGRPSSVVNGKWKALGLPVPPRKGRKLKR